jgi:hypothetical protein
VHSRCELEGEDLVAVICGGFISNRIGGTLRKVFSSLKLIHLNFMIFVCFPQTISIANSNISIYYIQFILFCAKSSDMKCAFVWPHMSNTSSCILQLK